MSYTKNELAEQAALKDLARVIVGDVNDYSVKQLDELFSVMKDNEEGCAEVEKYHLAEVWNEVSDELIML